MNKDEIYQILPDEKGDTEPAEMVCDYCTVYHLCHAVYRYDQYLLENQCGCVYQAGIPVPQGLDAGKLPGGHEGYSILEIYGKYAVYNGIIHSGKSAFHSHGGIFTG